MKHKNIKNQFDKREIAPSGDSWERLSAQLDGADKKKKRPLVYWISAIAAILIVALIANQMLSPSMEKDAIENGTMVNESSKTATDSQINDTVIESPVIENDNSAIAQETIKEEIAKDIPTQKLINKTGYRPAQKISNKAVSTAVATAHVVTEENKSMLKKSMVQPFEIVQTTVASNNLKSLTVEQEADLLLKEAFAKAELKPIASHSIKPEQLLRETEWDIESERRNRLENTLLDGLGVLKQEAVALIDRN
jgi:hypothetical protein